MEDENKTTDAAATKRKRVILIGAGGAALLLCGVLAVTALNGGRSGGATLGDYDGMTKEEIQAELDRQVAESMMTISLDMTPTLSEDGTKLAVRVANDESNRFDQLVEVEQGDKVIGTYKGLKPGEKIDVVDVDGAVEGDAVVTIHAMSDGEATGNPSSFEVVISKDAAE